MAHFLANTTVQYACACGILHPLTKLFFCRHCLVLRCDFCLCHEVDSHFCYNCVENIPSSEAKLKKYKCSSCFDCPSCQHTLSARATTVTVPRKGDEEASGDAKQSSVITRKMYYLACLACRWTSRDVGIPDQTVATGSWPESEYAHATRFALLMEHFQAVVLRDKQERQDYLRRKTPKQHKYPSLTDRTGLTVSMIRRQMGWSDKTPPKTKPIDVKPSEATEEVDQLPDSIFTEPVNLRELTTIRQQLAQPAGQPVTVRHLFPQHKSLTIKRSLRCRQCEHNIIKPEYNPSSIKYRIQLFASHHVPEIRVVQLPEKLQAGVATTLQLKFSNPTIYEMTVGMKELPSTDEETALIEEMKRATVTSTPTSLNASLSRQVSLTEEPRSVDKRVTVKTDLPDESFVLLHRDDAAEFDDDTQLPKGDPKFILWRRANKACVELSIEPQDNLAPGSEAIIGFTVQYSYVNTVQVPEKKDPQTHTLSSRVYIHCGTVSAK
ncbi:dynactin subunit 4 [Phlebotomus argentipes]|uniref:dynactin subunit 4 n=1 Tax=Phlebotomus argentipes TaxID=94469 RepID=UPI002892D962|nr:dynactin subunit 4 [Phlebotomus argentipes]